LSVIFLQTIIIAETEYSESGSGRPAPGARPGLIMTDKKRDVDTRHGKRLAEIRAYRELSQSQVANSIGVTVKAIQNYEHGRSRIATERLEALAHALKCTPGHLLEEPGAPLPRYRPRPKMIRRRLIIEMASIIAGLLPYAESAIFLVAAVL
jgi:transcriptional regulator with XRE-family HTH domain